MSNAEPRPDIAAKEFLFEVMHDKTADLRDRVNAAGKLIKMGMGDYSGVPRVHITIRGGLPGGLPRKKRFEDFSPEMQRDLLWIKFCYENGMLDPNLENWEVAGNA
jgi:hypothetical protein